MTMGQLVVAIATSAAASFAVAEGLVLTAHRHGRFTMDVPGAVQKFHVSPTPRVGGIGIYLALVTAFFLVNDPDAAGILATLLVAGVPALLCGLGEDVTKRIGVAARLLSTMVSGLVACWLGQTALTHVDVPGIDALLALAPVAVLFTAFAVSGIANAINIIDGFHGLASGTTTLALISLAAVAARVGDLSLMLAAIVLAAAVAGFWLVNFPFGRLFLGDGGAYFAGFGLGWLAVLLPMRNAAVSPWASLLVCGYPVIEVLYTIARRMHGRQSPAHPDRAHLHSLVATRVVHRRMRGLDPTLQNASVSVLMWLCAAIPALLGIASYASTPSLALGAVSCALLYHWLYRRLARS